MVPVARVTMVPAARVVNRSQLGSQPTAADSGRIAELVAATDSHGCSKAGDTPDAQVVGRQHVEFFGSEHNRKRIAVRTTLELLPPGCQSFLD